MLKKRAAAVLMTLGMLALLLTALLAITYTTGTDPKLYERLQLRYGVEEDDLRTLDTALVDYLKGDADALIRTGAFNQRETLHMRDVFGLFVLLRRTLTALLVTAAVCTAWGWMLCRDDRFRRGRNAAIAAGILLAACTGVLAAWGTRDFTGLFNAFHGVLFDNDLWQLDSATDILIRLCPEEMFRDMALRIGGCTLVFAVCLPLLWSVSERLIWRLFHGLRGKDARKG